MCSGEGYWSFLIFTPLRSAILHARLVDAFSPSNLHPEIDAAASRVGVGARVKSLEGASFDPCISSTSRYNSLRIGSYNILHVTHQDPKDCNPFYWASEPACQILMFIVAFPASIAHDHRCSSHENVSS